MILPAWSRRLLRIGLVSLAAAVVLALVAGLLGVWTVRRSFPTHDGDLTLPGLNAPVTVHRDGYGVPQIHADTAGDLFRAQGFVHAQDRFWEMDFRRHLTAGRLSELFGGEQVETDIFLRTLGWRRVAETEWEQVSDDTRRYLTAYAEGVNAWVAATGGAAATGGKSLHYRVLGLQRPGYEIEPWHPVDSLAWLKAMAWDLRGNMAAEIERAALLADGLTREQIGQLFPDYPYDEFQPVVPGGRVVDGVFVPEHGATADSALAGATAPATSDGGGGGSPATASPADGTGGGVPAGRADGGDGRAPVGAGGGGTAPTAVGTGLGSNSWVVAGAHTDTGAPILVNDPHLAPGMPGIWYQNGLHCGCGYRVSGFSFAGVPGVVIGHNDRIAWGFTNLNPDVTDLYLERIDGDRYQVDGRWRELTVREETIRVAGGEDRTVRVRRTHHGPLLSDADQQLRDLAAAAPVRQAVTDRAAGAPEPPAAGRAATGPAGGAGRAAGYGVSLAWTALAPGRTIEALFVLNQARDFDDFRRAASLFEVPAQNLVYADVDGTIGYQAPGTVPVRGAGDGRFIAPGWDPAFDWADEPVPFDELPYLLDPPDGLIVSANQAVTGPGYRPHLTADWGFGHRSARIHALLDEAVGDGPVGLDDMERMLFDNHHPLAPDLVPALLAAAPSTGPARELLREWDFRQPAGGEPGTPEAASSAAAAYFNATWRQLLTLTFDELPDDRRPGGSHRWFEVVTGLLAEPDSPWWDRRDTDRVERRDDVLARALDRAHRELTDTQGEDPTGWRWGELHTLELRDASLGSSGIAAVEALFNRGPVPVAGGSGAVNATSWSAPQGYEVVTVPSMRMVVDLSGFDSSRWVQLTGNSGHPYHPNYTDQLDAWRTGRLLPWPWTRGAVEDAATGTLTLTP